MWRGFVAPLKHLKYLKILKWLYNRYPKGRHQTGTGIPMKTILVLSILLSAIAWSPTFAELTNPDLDKIRLIVKDEVKSEIENSETPMKLYVDAKIESVKTPVAWLIGLLVAMIAIIRIPLAILTIFLGWRSIKDNAQEKQIEVLTRESEAFP